MSHSASSSVLNHLRLWVLQLEEHHEAILKDMETEDPYQSGYIHGLNHGIEHLRSQVAHVESQIKWASELLAAQEVDGTGER
jgi:peptide methionine sulfoxide reductase MsrB